MLEPGLVVQGRYRVVGPLGKGGMGTTYVAEDLERGVEVALKVLSMQSMSDWKVLELFEREARVLASLKHPGVPSYIDNVTVELGEGQGEAFCLVQELVDGASLAQKVEEARWRPDESEVRRLAGELLAVLCHLHERTPAVVHRDIKPQNVLLREDGRVALVDFGAVKDRARAEGSFASTMVGTYGYMAPEQLQGSAVPASDLYGLGTTLAFLLTGRPPAELPKKRLKVEWRGHTQASEAFGRWLDRLLEPVPEDRFASARDALEALEALERTSPASPRAGRPQGPPGDPPVVDDRPKPAGSKIDDRSDEDALDLMMPPAGLRAFQTGQVLGLLAALVSSLFALGIMWASMQLVPILISVIPLCLVVLFGWQVLTRALGEHHLRMTREQVVLEKRVLGRVYRKIEAQTQDIEHVDVKTINANPNGGTMGDRYINLEIGVDAHKLGEHLSMAENRWVVDRVERYRQRFVQPRMTLPQWDGESEQGDEREEVEAQAEHQATVQARR